MFAQSMIVISICMMGENVIDGRSTIGVFAIAQGKKLRYG